MCIGLIVKYPSLLPDFNGTLIFSKKYSNIKIHENPSSEGRGEGASCSMRTDRHDELISRFKQFANEPKNDAILQKKNNTNIL
jgi:hypothetical protein